MSRGAVSREFDMLSERSQDAVVHALFFCFGVGLVIGLAFGVLIVLAVT